MSEDNSLDKLESESYKAALESLLLVSTDPTPATDFAKVLQITPGEVVGLLADLSAEYSDTNRGIQLREVAGGWRLFTHPAYHEQVESLILSWDRRKLSQAALETLSVIAYYQPVTREGIKAVRGVNSEGVVSSLVEKGLVRELGREQGKVGSILYGTTNAFLERFGLTSLKSLPPLEDFAPDEESKKFIRERLSGRNLQLGLEEVAEDIDEEASLIDDTQEGEDEYRSDSASDIDYDFMGESKIINKEFDDE